MSCICGSSKNYDECCGPIISGEVNASSAEQLMRSRYSAYVRGDGRYLVLSTVKMNQHEEDAELIEEFSSSNEWLKLEVLHVEKDVIEFKAYYKEGDSVKVLHERSNFVLEDGVWYYKDGILFNSKVERNESYPCGSGKKFKKCCSN